MLKKLKSFIKKAIFKRDRYIFPPEEEGGYIVPRIWSECEAEKQWKREEKKKWK